MTNRSRDPFFYLALCVLVAVAMFALDVPVSSWVRDSHFPEWFKTILRVVRMPGIYWFTLVFAGVCALRFRWPWRDTAAFLLAGAVASGVTALLKIFFGRIRPFRGRAPFDWQPFPHSSLGAVVTTNLSFPSGDATLAFATAAMFAWFMPRWRAYGYAWATGVAITRVLQGAHYPSDVAAGALVGFLTGDAFIFMIRARQAKTKMACPVSVTS